MKPGFFTNELLAELPPFARLLFAGLWTLADREGRLEDRPRRIKASVFPFDEVDVTALLTALESKGFIDRYIVNGMPLIQIAKFAEHQTPHVREARSVLPAPCGEPRKGSALSLPRPPVPDPVPVTGLNGTKNVSSAAPLRAEPTAAIAVLTFPTAGSPKTWALTQGWIEEHQRLYEDVNVLAECRKALAWVMAAKKKKSAVGMPRFLVNWFNRANDHRGGRDRRTVDRHEHIWTCGHSPTCPPGTTPRECEHRSTFGEARWRELYPHLAAKLTRVAS